MKIIAYAVLGLLLLILSYLFYLGMFMSITVIEEKQGPFYFVYKNHKGDYNKIDSVIHDIKFALVKQEILPLKLVGIYYDDPHKVEKPKLRSEAGCLIKKADLYKAQKLKREYRIKVIPRQNYLVAEFPYKNRFSLFMGVAKVYPALRDYLAEKKLEEKYSLVLYDDPLIIDRPVNLYLMTHKKK